jgi:hypothetical protein
MASTGCRAIIVEYSLEEELVCKTRFHLMDTGSPGDFKDMLTLSGAQLRGTTMKREYRKVLAESLLRLKKQLLISASSSSGADAISYSDPGSRSSQLTKRGPVGGGSSDLLSKVKAAEGTLRAVQDFLSQSDENSPALARPLTAPSGGKDKDADVMADLQALHSEREVLRAENARLTRKVAAGKDKDAEYATSLKQAIQAKDAEHADILKLALKEKDSAHAEEMYQQTLKAASSKRDDGDHEGELKAAVAMKEQEHAAAIARKEEELNAALQIKDEEHTAVLELKEEENMRAMKTALAEKDEEHAQALQKKEEEHSAAMAARGAADQERGDEDQNSDKELVLELRQQLQSKELYQQTALRAEREAKEEEMQAALAEQRAEAVAGVKRAVEEREERHVEEMEAKEQEHAAAMEAKEQEHANAMKAKEQEHATAMDAKEAEHTESKGSNATAATAATKSKEATNATGKDERGERQLTDSLSPKASLGSLLAPPLPQRGLGALPTLGGGLPTPGGGLPTLGGLTSVGGGGGLPSLGGGLRSLGALPGMGQQQEEQEEEGGKPDDAEKAEAEVAEEEYGEELEEELEEEEEEMFPPGTEVEARFGGEAKFYPGKIEKVNGDGTYGILYADGDSEESVARSMIRAVANPSTSDLTLGTAGDKVAVGTAVEARFGGEERYFPGKIEKANADGSYEVLFDDGDREANVGRELIRVVSTAGEVESGVVAGGGGVDEGGASDGMSSDMSMGDLLDDEDGSGEEERKVKKEAAEEQAKKEAEEAEEEQAKKEAEEAEEQAKKEAEEAEEQAKKEAEEQTEAQTSEDPLSQTKKRELEMGAEVEARFGGEAKFYPGKIEKVNGDGTYGILYADGDSEESVARSMIRAAQAAQIDGDAAGGGVDEGGASDGMSSDMSMGDLLDDDDDALDDTAEQAVKKQQTQQDDEQGERGGDGDGDGFAQEDDGGEDDPLRQTAKSAGGLDGYAVGTAIEARFGGEHKYYPGTIEKVNGDDTYAILYADGDSEQTVTSDLIRLATEPTDEGDGFAAADDSAVLSMDEEDFADDDLGDDHDLSGLSIGIGDDATIDAGSSVVRSPPLRDLGLPKFGADGGQGDEAEDADNVVNEGALHSRENQALSPSLQSLVAVAASAAGAAGGDESLFKVGTGVEARFGGEVKYYPGKIEKVNGDGTYGILYADGDSEESVARSMMRLETVQTNDDDDAAAAGAQDPLSQTTKRELEMGTGVEARFGGEAKFYPGKIEKVNGDGTYGILYADGDSEESVARSMIRVRAAVEAVGAAGGELEVGTAVEARFGAGQKYFSGKIEKVNGDGTFSILYDDGDRENNVGHGLIRSATGGGDEDEDYGDDFEESGVNASNISHVNISADGDLEIDDDDEDLEGSIEFDDGDGFSGGSGDEDF